MENHINRQKEHETRFDKQDLCLHFVFPNICSEVAITLPHFSLKLNLAKRYIPGKQQTTPQTKITTHLK